MGLKLVAASAPISFLDDVARFGEVSDDSKGASFRDTERGPDVPQPDPGVVGDAEQDLGVVGQEVPRSGVPGTHGLPFGQSIARYLFLEYTPVNKPRSSTRRVEPS